MQPGVTCIVSLRLPPAYAAAIDDLAASLGQSKISLFRRAVEHYVSTARPEADPALVQHLLDLGSQIRDRPHPSSRWRPEALNPTTTTEATPHSEGR
ncbi:ribbon-helix-helix domain-containing protein [Cyanobium gracile]|uniref:ribbon-helix-helix domain-containing protein n=1 Tax=Cyanobium gracile TaxID=59930 RepID=UPI002B20AAF6|nr:ribbon-helix-helix domain-containing protein [Cyanobium gracile]